MARTRAKSDFGFPRWGGYGRDQDAATVQQCDAEGCTERGDHPARKSPFSNERWHFCETHAAEYNRNWDFFRSVSEEDARRFTDEADGSASGYARANPWSDGWGGAETDGVSRADRAAYDALDLDPGASTDEIKAQFRRLAKQYHPDRNPGDATARERFHAVRAAYDRLVPKTAKTGGSRR
ncbi:DnaJ-like protein [Rhodothalassium salexigens DSM 2132]|uniref:DnaJ-like protein n=1 Tax=Rhodothalassium salexigens DSM 2132 TaxID=1188247 RepID=A0A4R2PL94_RHOSA|nr:DnaJ domain-containing protein [Rhodothalassium salexigens]MBB4210963.1 DnaJ-domain-containing protein 1 [Rhodothalassium salexigens DSM 2132]MBK1638695.1 hypothetical protein [Rhodothalassium salexigens DSM 2132]TCP36379.1 DnaJ-like protein [Rhodothalassium salexigens DSM 2132]